MDGCLQEGRPQNTDHSLHFRNPFPLSPSVTSPLPNAHWNLCNLAHHTPCLKKREIWATLSPILFLASDVEFIREAGECPKGDSHLNFLQSGKCYRCQDHLESEIKGVKKSPPFLLGCLFYWHVAAYSSLWWFFVIFTHTHTHTHIQSPRFWNQTSGYQREDGRVDNLGGWD